jgi:hypothetical protein
MKICGVENPGKVFGVAGAKIWGVEMTKPWDGIISLAVMTLPDASVTPAVIEPIGENCTVVVPSLPNCTVLASILIE